MFQEERRRIKNVTLGDIDFFSDACLIIHLSIDLKIEQRKQGTLKLRYL